MGKRQPNPAVIYEYEGRDFHVKEGDKKSLPIRPSGCGALLVPTEERWEGNWVACCPEDDTHARVALCCWGDCSDVCTSNQFVEMSFVEREELRDAVMQTLDALPCSGDDSPSITCTGCGWNFMRESLPSSCSPPQWFL